MSADAVPSSSPFLKRVQRRLRSWRRRYLPAFLQKKDRIVKKGPFESVLGEDKPHRYLPYREPEDKPPWYRGDEDLLLVLPDRVKEFYRRYACLESPLLEARLCQIRRQAWPLGNYPAFGSWTFVQDALRAHPFYPELVSRLKGGATLLEAGPGLGQDLRYLAHDGAPTDRMLAVDERLDLWKLGYELFNDDGYIQQQQQKKTKKKKDSNLSPGDYGRSDFQVRFIEANVHRWPFVEQYKKLHGTVDIVMANNFFNNAVEWTSSKCVIRMIEPFTKVGTLFLGYHFAPDREFVYTSEDMSYFDGTSLKIDVFDQGLPTPGRNDCQWVTESYTTVDLKEWGFEEKHWNWVRDCKWPEQIQQMRGAYYVMRRIR